MVHGKLTRAMLFGLALLHQGVAAGEVRETESGVLVVTATRTERPVEQAPVSTEIVDEVAIEASGAINVAEALERNTNIFLPSGFAGVGVELQGLSSEYTLILVDGQKLPGRKAGVIDLSRISLHNVKRIEIIRGASSALYGADALAGVINIITKASHSPFLFKGTLGGSMDGHVNARGEAGAVLHGISSHFTAAVDSRPAFKLEPGSIATTGMESTQVNLSTRNHFTLGDSWSFDHLIDYLYRDQVGVDASANGAVFDRQNRIETFLFQLNPTLELTRDAHLRITSGYSIFRDQYLSDQRDSSSLDKISQTREHLAQLGVQWNSNQWQNHRLSLGADASFEHLASDRLIDGEGGRQRGALYFQNEWALGFLSGFSLVPGARLDYDSQFGAQLTPKLGLVYRPFEPLTLRASYGRGYRPPSFKELLLDFQNPGAGYRVFGNPELKPELSDSFNAGAEYRFLERGQGGFNLFRNNIKNMIIARHVAEGADGRGAGYSYSNIGEAFTQGVQAFVKMPVFRFASLNVAHTYTTARDVTQGRRLEGRARQRTNMGLDGMLPFTRTSLFLNATRVGSRRFFDVPGPSGVIDRFDTAPHLLVSLNLQQRVRRTLQLFVNAQNLFNAGDPLFLPIEPRSVMIGLRGQS